MFPCEQLDQIPPDELHQVMIAERYHLSKARSNHYSPPWAAYIKPSTRLFAECFPIEQRFRSSLVSRHTTTKGRVVESACIRT